MEEMKAQGVGLFILGCRELSLAYTMYKLQGNLVDVLEIIATRAIEFSGGKIRTF